MNVLIVVDMQNDFIDGSLGTEEAKRILPNLLNKIKSFNGQILFTQDTHQNDYLSTQEGRNLPVPHCIENTHGWQISAQLLSYIKEDPIKKITFGSTELMSRLEELNSKTPIKSITLVGLCTDICVISNALMIKATLPEIPVIVDASCCAGVTPESHKTSLDAMKSCQIVIENE